MRFSRGRTGAALAVAALSLVATPAGAETCAGRSPLPDQWTRISPPSFPAGGSTMLGYDASDGDVDRLVVTNGTLVFSTTDGGCTWVPAGLPADSALPELPAGEERTVTRTIGQVRFGGRTRTGVWALGQTVLVAGGPVTVQPRVLYSGDGGRTFAQRVSGLPSFGRPVAVRGIAGDAAVLLFESTFPKASYDIYLTGDGGRSWTELWSGLPKLDDIGLDMVGAFDIWAWGENGAYRASLLDDQEPRLVTGIQGAVQTVDFALGSSGTKVITAFLRSGSERFVSTDGGETFGRTPAPENVQSATSYPLLPGLMAISSLDVNVLVEPPARYGGRPVDFSPHDEAVSDVQFVGALVGNGFPLYAFNPLALFLRILPVSFVAPPQPPPPPVDVEVEQPPVALPPPPKIEPVAPVVTLRPGQRKVVDFSVSLPAVPGPIDVLFMTDSTDSMSDTIASVQQGVQDIVDGLARSGADAYFGIADFRDYPQTPLQSANFPYRLHRKVGPIDNELAEALEDLTTGGGTTDGDDSALEAIYQGATGAGRVDATGRVLIKPGLDAGFRADAMKVILVASDDGMRQPDAANPGYPGPRIGEVTRALNERGIYVVGIEVHTGSDSPRRELEHLAQSTGATAPVEGVDCDGDGHLDLAYEEPMVCEFEPDGGSAIADAFIAMLNGIEELAEVRLVVDGPPAFVRATGPLVFPDVNVKAPSRYRLPVEFRCTADNAGTETPVRIAARSHGDEIVATTATLRCASPEAPEPPRAVPPLVAAGLVPPAPPPAPVSNVQPNMNPNPNPNPQVNTNAGFASQEEQELQLALANIDDGPDEEYAMTGLAWATAVAMTAAAAYGMQLTRRARPAPAHQTPT